MSEFKHKKNTGESFAAGARAVQRGGDDVHEDGLRHLANLANVSKFSKICKFSDGPFSAV